MLSGASLPSGCGYESWCALYMRSEIDSEPSISCKQRRGCTKTTVRNCPVFRYVMSHQALWKTALCQSPEIDSEPSISCKQRRGCTKTTARNSLLRRRTMRFSSELRSVGSPVPRSILQISIYQLCTLVSYSTRYNLTNPKRFARVRHECYQHKCGMTCRKSEERKSKE